MSYPIGTPGQPWNESDIAAWRARLTCRRSYADDILTQVLRARPGWDCLHYGDVRYDMQSWPLHALRCSDWQDGRPCVLVTGGVHGYETSGVLGALRFVDEHAAAYLGRVNLLVVPCVSPWGYERVQRWNYDALDPNRSFYTDSPAQESAALMRLVAAQAVAWDAHIDLHETTDSDESEFRPALAARDGKSFEPGSVPDGFYLVDDTERPTPAFQQAIIDAVARVTHIAPADGKGQIIGSPVVAPGVIRYQLRAWGLCAGITGARFVTTTEVYPDSTRTTPEECNAAQATVVCAALDFVLTP